jgi:hypothetical protein
MESYQQRTHHRHRKTHRYSLEEFGLARGRVLDELSDYIEAYDIAPDVKRAAAR